MREWLTCLREGHTWQFLRTVYGDELHKVDARPLWACTRCKTETWTQKQAPALGAPDTRTIVGGVND